METDSKRNSKAVGVESRAIIMADGGADREEGGGGGRRREAFGGRIRRDAAVPTRVPVVAKALALPRKSYYR